MNVRSYLVVLSALAMSVGLAGCDSGPSAPVGGAQQGRPPEAATGGATAQPPQAAAGGATTQPQAAAAAELKSVHFDLDQALIRSGDVRLLDANARWLKSQRNTAIVIGGHADERGSDDYNTKLGERRANAVKKYLIAHGVEADRITTTSHGERRPVCTEHAEGCWAKNRRAEFEVKVR